MKCNKCGEFVKKGFANHLYHIFRHYKWWGNDCIWDQNNNGGLKMSKIRFEKEWMRIYNQGRYFERKRCIKIVREHCRNLLDLEIITNYNAYGVSRKAKTCHLKVNDFKLWKNDLILLLCGFIII